MNLQQLIRFAVDLAPELACSPRKAEEEWRRPAAAFAVGVALAKRCESIVCKHGVKASSRSTACLASTRSCAEPLGGLIAGEALGRSARPSAWPGDWLGAHGVGAWPSSV